MSEHTCEKQVARDWTAAVGRCLDMTIDEALAFHCTALISSPVPAEPVKDTSAELISSLLDLCHSSRTRRNIDLLSQMLAMGPEHRYTVLTGLSPSLGLTLSRLCGVAVIKGWISI
jgi:hypothetical protein